MILLGAGRVGRALHRRSAEVGLETRLLTRDSGWEALSEPPGEAISLTVRSDDLDTVIAQVPRHRLPDLVFLQNGMLRPWLNERGLQGVTRGLLFLAVASRSAPIVAGGQSPFIGPHAGEMVEWFAQMGLPAVVVDWPTFCALELEKLLWNAAFGLLCDVQEADVGTIARTYRNELRAVVGELARVGRASTGVAFELEPLVERLCAYSLAIPGFRAGLREWPWRNGWFHREAQRMDIAIPVHTALMEGVQPKLLGDRA